MCQESGTSVVRHRKSIISVSHLDLPGHRLGAYVPLANEPPLYIRLVFDGKPNQIPPLGIRVQPDLDLHVIGFKQKDTVQSSISATPPWLLDHPRVKFDLHCLPKEDTPPEIYRSRFHELCSHYDGFRRLYTRQFKDR